MIKIPRFAKPSWWVFHWQRRNAIRFWWNKFNVRPFPEDCTSLEELVAFGRLHRVMGFNNECIRSYIIWRLFKEFNCTSFVETGTFYGATTAYVSKVFKTPVFTGEINRTRYLVSKLNLLWDRNINQTLADSPEFLNRVLDPSILGNNPMFYLDAHWREHVPLGDELALIGDRSKRGLILIDDFMVPWDANYLYDEYPSMRIDMDVINSYLKNTRDDVHVYLPTYTPHQEPTGKGIGFAVAIMGQEQQLPYQTFPFDLLGPEGD